MGTRGWRSLRGEALSLPISMTCSVVIGGLRATLRRTCSLVDKWISTASWFLHHGLADTGLKLSFPDACSHAFGASFGSTGAEPSSATNNYSFEFNDMSMWDHIANRESVVVTTTGDTMRWMAFIVSQEVDPRFLVELMVNLGEGKMDEIIEANRDD